MRKRISIVLLVLAVLIATSLAFADRLRIRGSSKGVFFTTNQLLDVSTTGNVSLDTEASRNCVFEARLITLSGGSSPEVDFIYETSADNVSWNPHRTNPASCAAACDKSDYTAGGHLRYVRIAWVTTGTPTTADANINIRCTKY